VPIAQKYLKYASNSVLTSSIDQKHPPKGLYALILVAVRLFLLVMVEESYTHFSKVERGFSAHISGTYMSPRFNYDYCWKPLEDFFKNVDKIKVDRWAILLEVRSNSESEQDDVVTLIMLTN
jgi:hypothetical protein